MCLHSAHSVNFCWINMKTESNHTQKRINRKGIKRVYFCLIEKFLFIEIPKQVKNQYRNHNKSIPALPINFQLSIYNNLRYSNQKWQIYLMILTLFWTVSSNWYCKWIDRSIDGLSDSCCNYHCCHCHCCRCRRRSSNTNIVNAKEKGTCGIQTPDSIFQLLCATHEMTIIIIKVNCVCVCASTFNAHCTLNKQINKQTVQYFSISMVKLTGSFVVAAQCTHNITKEKWMNGFYWNDMWYILSFCAITKRRKKERKSKRVRWRSTQARYIEEVSCTFESIVE